MTEPIRAHLNQVELRARNEAAVRTESLEQLIGPKAFTTQSHERGRMMIEKKRDALIAGRLPTGELIQWIVIATLDAESGSVAVELLPTHGTLQSHPKLEKIKYSARAKGDAAEQSAQRALRSVIDEARTAGYQFDAAIDQALAQTKE